jgi:hypothetical protein
MSDFSTKPVKIIESDYIVSQQKVSYETINKLCPFFTPEEPSTYLAYLHYNKDLLTDEEVTDVKERYEIVLHNRNVKNKLINERFLNKNDETFCEEEGLTDVCCNENKE